MANKELLPGINPDDTCPPVAVFDSHRAIARARRRAAFRDAAQLLLLVSVDWFFVRWPYAHVPTFDRAHSLLIVALLNVVVATHVIVSRALPRWTAQRIARTWALSERARFFQR